VDDLVAVETAWSRHTWRVVGHIVLDNPVQNRLVFWNG
jgi:hypothetical protein